jgi:type II secretory pathway predicted ATPase ExeA
MPKMTMTMTRPRTDSYRQRFGLTHHPLPRDAAGASFFSQTAGLLQLDTQFQELLEEPGLGLLTGEAGVGKTAAIRNLCAQLPSPDYLVIYLCDTSAAPCDVYRTLALELGLSPSHRKSQLWWDIKAALARLLDEQHTTPVIIVDEGQHLSDRFLADLSGFLNFAFDRRSLAALWLVGLPSLARRLKMQLHAPLHTRIAAQVHLLPLEREDFRALIEHAIKAAGSREKLLTDSALELLFRACRGVVRIASRVLRAALKTAHLKNQNIIDDQALKAAIEELVVDEEVKS